LDSGREFLIIFCYENQNFPVFCWLDKPFGSGPKSETSGHRSKKFFVLLNTPDSTGALVPTIADFFYLLNTIRRLD